MTRTLILGGREIVIEALRHPLDEAFDRLHAAYFGDTPLAWDEFEAVALQYFTNNAGSTAAHDAYFNNFTVIWRNLLDAGRYDHAERLWQQALQPALRWEEANPNQRLHKGTPYYFWSMTVLLRGDIDQGYLLIHQAVDEDIRTSGQRTPDTPGYALVSLNYQRVDQAFRQWVIAQAQFLSDLLTNYTTTHTRTLTLSDVKQRFLDRPPGKETIFLLTYTLARLMKLAALPLHTTKNPFAGQLQLNLLFGMTLVIDTAIKAKNNTKWKFIDHAEHLLTTVGAPLSNQELGEINGQFNNNFDATLAAALDGTLAITYRALNRLQCDVALAYGLRNHGAHNTGTAGTMWNRFTEVQQALFRAFFATIDHLY